jgi:hypothetical protein
MTTHPTVAAYIARRKERRPEVTSAQLVNAAGDEWFNSEAIRKAFKTHKDFTAAVKAATEKESGKEAPQSTPTGK